MGTKSIYKSEEGASKVEAKVRELFRLWPIEKQELQVETRHGRTNVTACGSAGNPPLLLLHPENINSVYWLDQVQTYARSHRVFAVDIPGEPGLSAQSRPALRDNAWAEWLDDIFGQLGTETAALAGASLGAWICLKFACNWPERVDRLALITPPGVVRRRRSRSTLFTAASSFLGPLGRDLIYRSQINKSGLDPKLKDALTLAQRHLKSRSLQLPRFSDRELGQLYCPILLVLGGKDAYFDADQLALRAVRAMPQVEINYRNREAHFVSAYTREIDRFLISQNSPD
ncbi:alpha/beta hydrolase [Proteobacteria bacterium 005FR1]|nr:alpha/beta hydrolase [Proteobacteria bacterium 005FR1]